MPNALFFDLLNSDIFQELYARPTRLADRIPEGFGDWIVVDEIQKIPVLLDELHRLIETKNYRFN